MADWSKRYVHTEANVRAYAPTSGGVYRLIHKESEKYIVFYVGQSEDLEGRLLEHLSPSEPNSCIRRHLRDYSCFFRFLKVGTEDERLRIECEQIEQYKPACNG